jgi:hypothetical protein
MVKIWASKVEIWVNKVKIELEVCQPVIQCGRCPDTAAYIRQCSKSFLVKYRQKRKPCQKIRTKWREYIRHYIRINKETLDQ